MARDGAQPAYDPAGHDTALRSALQEVRAGRWMSMRALLEQTASWSAWTRRTQVLATSAAGTDVVRAWLAEEPDSVAAAVMHTRVVVERALRAHRESHPRTRELWPLAWHACDAATRVAPYDPVPWVCLLALARLDEEQRWAEHRAAPPEPMLPPGPWGLLAEAGKRDPYNREAHHRMLQFLYPRGGSERLARAAGFAQWAAGSAPPGSALHVLPLYVRVERYRRSGGREAALDLHWVAEDATREARQAFHSWFTLTQDDERSLLDMNHLAHALWGALRFPEAAQVFDALGPYWTPLPWASRAAGGGGSQQPVEIFLQARTRSRSAARGGGRRS
ncbi:hypothetical protein [Streptomyces pactum]|uniref:DUF4034 domain-containing protein n=1 Tax=Streptomyces pactum TaxID=68249 RepID=A0A1S6J3Q4_9ACTN|nr:hypothetical protein [Streptomyces pactum]AQS66371.1 hypothetical protein B1H29_05010 [Streptomyces pactum]